MNEILDEDFTNLPKEPISKENLVIKSLGYIFVMFFGGYFFSQFFNPQMDPILGSIGFVFWVIIPTILMEIFRWIWKSVNGIKLQFENPYWFEFIENMMSMWIILVGFNFLNLIFKVI